MPKSSRNKTKCKCGGCRKCILRNNLRKTIGIKKHLNELKMSMANQCDKHGTSVNVGLRYNHETDRVEIGDWNSIGNSGVDNTGGMMKTLGKIDGGFYNLKLPDDDPE